MAIQPPANTVVLDHSRSPHARLRGVPIDRVKLEDEFLEPRRQINRRTTIPSQHQLCEQTGRINNLRRATGKDFPFVGEFPFNDSDIYKWLEAASWTLATHPTAALRKMVNDTVRIVADAQQPDGYLNSYFHGERFAQRYTNLKESHELYCAGHLMQAAVAHFRAIGEMTLLKVARRLADHLCETFGPEQSARRAIADGHQQIEMGLVELYRATGERRYLEQAQFSWTSAAATGSGAGNTGRIIARSASSIA